MAGGNRWLVLVSMALVQFGLLPVILFNCLFLQDVLDVSPVLAGVGVMPVILRSPGRPRSAAGCSAPTG